MRISIPGAPVFSLALDNEATGSGLRQVCCRLLSHEAQHCVHQDWQLF